MIEEGPSKFQKISNFHCEPRRYSLIKKEAVHNKPASNHVPENYLVPPPEPPPNEPPPPP